MSDIIGAAAAKSALTNLVSRIRSSLETAKGLGASAYAQAVDAAQRDLDTFFKSTKPADFADAAEVAAVRKIDEVAFNLLVDLSLEEMEANVQKLEQGAQKLQAISVALADQAAANSAAAAAIGLQPIKQAVDSMTGLVNSVKALKTNLKADDPDQAKVAAEIENLVAQFQRLKSAVQAAA